MHYTWGVRSLVFESEKRVLITYKQKGIHMKKIMIFLAAMAMTTLFAQANQVSIKTPATTTALETEAPIPTEGDTNGTTEEGVPGR